MSDIQAHLLSSAKALHALQSREQGLMDREVLVRQKKVGPNRLPEAHADSRIKIFLRQFRSALMVILFSAGALSLFLGDWVDAGVIAAAGLLNIVVGFIQEFRAQEALLSLKRVVVLRAFVIRNGQEQQVLASDLVPGDILQLRTGDGVPTDARLLATENLEVNEAPLTGESTPVSKQVEPLTNEVPIADRSNMVFFGTLITSGTAQAVVTATGEKTEMGKIAALLKSTSVTDTPLQTQLTVFSRRLGIMILLFAVLIFFAGTLLGEGMIRMLTLAVALAVAAIPEGLMVSLTAILAIGMRRILKRHGLVRHLFAAETLGSTTVICTDKTGTLTQGTMHVSAMMTMDHVWESTQEHAAAEEIIAAFRLATLCNDAALLPSKEGESEGVGNITDQALLRAAHAIGLDKKTLEEAEPRIDTQPFSSENKFMVTLHQFSPTQNIAYLKGAPEKLLGLCTHVLQGDRRQPLTEELRGKIQEQFRSQSERGRRLLALAQQKVRKNCSDVSKVLSGNPQWVFVGFVSLHDPIRPGVVNALNETKNAGIRTIMITGDHPLTARAIAQEIGLPGTKDAIVRGDDMMKMTDDELTARVRHVSIFARVSPQDKLRIVRALQANHEVVAMTGDGVNDAPALKSADIGVALGSGTDVAKDTADLVLLDNRFETIVAAVREGRVIFENIRRVVLFLVSGSFAEILIVTGSLLIGAPLPLTALQILWINLVTDTFPNMALTVEPEEENVMSVPPRPRHEPLLNNQVKWLIAVVSVFAGLANLLIFWIVYRATDNMAVAQTVTFASLGTNSLLYVFSMRTLRKSFGGWNLFSNPTLTGAVFVSIVVQLFAIYLPPLARILGLVPLRWFEWALALSTSVVVIAFVEWSKKIFAYAHQRS